MNNNKQAEQATKELEKYGFEDLEFIVTEQGTTIELGYVYFEDLIEAYNNQLQNKMDSLSELFMLANDSRTNLYFRHHTRPIKDLSQVGKIEPGFYLRIYANGLPFKEYLQQLRQEKLDKDCKLSKEQRLENLHFFDLGQNNATIEKECLEDFATDLLAEYMVDLYNNRNQI